MKRLRHSLLTLIGLGFAATAFAGPIAPPPPPSDPAPVGGPYISIAAGALWLHDADIGPADIDFDTGFSIMGALGYSFGNGFAVEVESGYMQVDSAEVDILGFNVDLDGEFEQVPIMANAVYTHALTDRLSLYIGGGAGIVWSDVSIDNVGGFDVDIDAEDEWNFAAQAKAGLSFQVCPEATVNIGYRYFFGHDAIGGVDDSHGSVLEGGFTWRF
jgi:opacity protein-like surface antigen